MRAARTVLTVVVLVVAVVVFGGWARAPARSVVAAPHAAPAGKLRTSCSSQELGGDFRLGPATLANGGVLGRILAGYRRFAGLTRTAFIAKYWAGSKDQGSYIYPPHMGFKVIRRKGHTVVVMHVERLRAGEEIDRFGSTRGTFLSPAGTLYDQRALPPLNLDVPSPQAGAVCDYHLYKVLKPFRVVAGPIAPAFGQPGGGEQFLIEPQLFSPPYTGPVSVQWLLDEHYVAALPLSASR